MSHGAVFGILAVVFHLHHWPGWREIVGNLPTDPASIFVLLLLAGSVAWVAWGSRRKGPGGKSL